MDLITWRSFMDMDDDAPIEDVIKNLDRLKVTFSETVTSIAKDGDRLGGEYAMLASEAKKLITSLEGVKIANEKQQAEIQESANLTEKLSKAAVANKEAQEANKKALDDTTKATQSLDTAKKSLLNGQSTELGSLDALKKKLDLAAKSYAAMGEATDQAVKDEQLKKIEELNQQYTTQKKVLDDAKKSTTAAVGSYDALNKKVNDSKKALKAMEGSLDGNSKEFKALQKEVKEGTKQLKEWDEKVGDNQRKVGDYKNQIGELIPGFNGLAGAVETTGKSLWALAANPVGAVILAIVAALGALTAYFTRTETGGDKLAEMLGGLKGIFTFLLDQIAKFGGMLFEALSSPEKIFKSISGLANDLKTKIVGVFQDPLPAIKAFGQFLIDQVVNRVTGMIDVFKNLGGAIKNLFTGDFSAFQDNLKGLANATLQVVTGVEGLADKIADVIQDSGITDMLERARQIGVQIAQLKDKLEDQEVALIKKRADTELAVNQKLLDSKDKLRLSDEDRFKAIREVSKISDSLLKSEIAAAQTKIDIAKQEIALRKLSLTDAEIPLDLIKAQIEAEAELTGLKSARLQQQKRLQMQEIAIIREIETEMLNRAKREMEAETNLAKARSDIRQKQLQQTANDVRLDVETRNKAVMDATNEQVRMAELAAEQSLAASKEAALARIELDAETLQTIYNNESLSVAQRIELERKMKEEKLAEDQAYVNETDRINEELVAKTDEMNTKMLEIVQKNIFTQLQTDFNELKNQIDASTAGALESLNNEFAEGNMSIAEYEKERQDIIAASNRQILSDTLDMLEEKRLLLEKDGQDTSAVENEIAQARLKLSQMTTDELLEYEQKLEDAKAELRQVAYDSFVSIVGSQFEAEQARLDERMERMTAQRDLELQLAGDNEAKKAEIANKYALEEDRLRKQQAEAKRKQAIFDKARAVFEIGINTGVAIVKAVAASPLTGGLPFSAIAAAIGALQIAAVLAKPIPSFAVGTDNAPGGIARINELGPELIVDPQGNSYIINSDGATYADIPKGSTIYTARETENIINYPMADQLSAGMRLDAEEISVISEQRHDRELARVFREGFSTMENAIKKSRPRDPASAAEMEKAFRKSMEWQKYLDENYR